MDWLQPRKASKPAQAEAPPAHQDEAKSCSCAAVKPPAVTAWTWTLSSLGLVVLGCSGLLLVLLVCLMSALSESRDMIRLLVQSQLGVNTRRVDV